MTERPTQFLLYRGDVVLGEITLTHDDFPWHYGKFEAGTEFRSVSHLFETELRVLKETQGTGEWDKAYDLISSAGLRLEPVGPGKVINDPLVHIQGDVAWWR